MVIGFAFLAKKRIVCYNEEKGVVQMKKVKITAIHKACYKDLMEKYENPILHTCDVVQGQVWVSENGEKPDGF